MTEVEELRIAVKALATLVGEMLAEASGPDAPMVLTADEGHEMLDFAFGDLDPALRQKYFEKIDRYYPRHSTEQE
jgi:predicted O-methyltransferase YrrM